MSKEEDQDGVSAAALYECTVTFVGVNARGDKDVTLVWATGNKGSSNWPDWAFEQARLALLHGKKVSVRSNGEPASNTILDISITNKPA